MKLSLTLFFCSLFLSVVHGVPSDRPTMRRLRLARNELKKIGRSDGRNDVLHPKIFIISLFTPEAAVWIQPLNLYAINVTVPSFSPLFPDAHCDDSGEICLLTTGESGIAGVNPACGTIGGVAFAKYAVQVGLEYQVDAREIPSNYSSGYIPLGAKASDDYPVFLYGTEAFELNENLRDRAFSLASKAELNDTPAAAMYRALYPSAPANAPPSVFKGDTETSDVFWHGARLGDAFEQYVNAVTNGSGRYCMTAQEDNAALEAFIRGALYGLIDIARIILMRTGANFDRAPPGIGEPQQLLYQDQGAFLLSTQNIYLAGIEVVNDIKANWETVYEGGIAPLNYVGDIWIH